MLSILGSQSLLFGAWVVGGHLPRRAVDALLRASTVVIAVALLLSFAAWQRSATPRQPPWDLPLHFHSPPQPHLRVHTSSALQWSPRLGLRSSWPSRVVQ